MSETLKIFDKTFDDVKGFKAKNTNNDVVAAHIDRYSLEEISADHSVYDDENIVITSDIIYPYTFMRSKFKHVSCPNLIRFTDSGSASTDGGGSYVFARNTDLIDISLPSLTTMGSGGYQFAYCTSLTDVYMPLSNTGAHMFEGCTSLERIALPRIDRSPTTMNGAAFQNCSSLEIIDLGNISKISSSEFSGCAALKTLILRNTTLITLGNTNNFSNNTPFKSGGSGGTIYIPKSLYDHLGDGTASDYTAATNWSTINGYGTITWEKIEGSQYEDYYADGRPSTIIGINVIFAQENNIVYDTDNLDSLKNYLIVKAVYIDLSTKDVSVDDCTLSGMLDAGTSTITVSYKEKTNTFNVIVTEKNLNIIPSNYTIVDYIENNVTDNVNLFINTELDATYGTQNYEHEIVFANVTSNANASSIYGLRLAAANIYNSRTCWVKNNGNQVIYADHDSGYVYTTALNEKIKIRTTANAENAMVYINDVQDYSGSKTGFEPVSGGTFYIFGIRQTSPSNAKMLHKVKIYSFKVKNLITNKYSAYFIPCLDENNVAGFYDTVREKFYTASSSSYLIGGNDS